MKHIVIAVIAIVVVAFLVMRSCSGGGSKYEQFDQKIELTPNENKVKGYLSEVLEVVDGTYTFDFKGTSATSYNSGTGKIQVKIKSVSKGDSNDYGLNDGNSGPLYLTICDKNGTPLTDFADIANEYTSDGILKDMMTNNSENWISFEITIHGGKKVPETAATFFVTSKKIDKLNSFSSDEKIMFSMVVRPDLKEVSGCRNIFIRDVWNDFYSDSYYKVMLERLVAL